MKGEIKHGLWANDHITRHQHRIGFNVHVGSLEAHQARSLEDGEETWTPSPTQIPPSIPSHA